MEYTTLFSEFSIEIGKKYSYIAEIMQSYCSDLEEFFDENELAPEKFSKNHLKEFVEDWMDYVDMTEAECCILFQFLIDFCSFCKEKGINYDFLKEYLLKNKKKLFNRREKNELSSEIMNPKELLENFDAYYALMRLSRKDNKLEFDKLIDFLEKTYELMKISFETSMDIRKKNPKLSDEEYSFMVDEEINKKHGKRLFKDIPQPEKFFEMISQLPKDSSKKILELSFKMGDTTNFKFGSIKRREVLEELLNHLEKIIEDLKKQKKEKNARQKE